MASLIRLPIADSTMDVLHALAADGAEAGTVVVAAEQVEGRGSRGRDWLSPKGGLWLSALFRPRTAAGVELYALRIGLAVAEAIEALGPGMGVEIKWPNDLILSDRKLGGILCEARWQGEVLAWVVAGVGINVTNPIPPHLGWSAIALLECLPQITVERVEREVTSRLRKLRSLAAVLEPRELQQLRERDWLSGRRLRAPAIGVAAGISEAGALLVRQDSGGTVPVRAGTVELADRSFTP